MPERSCLTERGGCCCYLDQMRLQRNKDFLKQLENNLRNLGESTLSHNSRMCRIKKFLEVLVIGYEPFPHLLLVLLPICSTERSLINFCTFFFG